MKFFRKRTPERTQNTWSGRINQSVIKRQHKIADYLNRKASFLSAKALIFLLIIFCIVYGTYCLRLIFNAFN